MAYLFTSESVSEGHPDKVSDQVSDRMVDEYLRQDPNSKVACETLVTTGLTVLSGEVKTEGNIEPQEVARDMIREIGYTHADYMFEADSCGVISAIHGQSPDINQGVERESEEEQGAGDQGMMFGYATKESDNYMPLSLSLSHLLLLELADIRKNTDEMPYLRPDAKSQVTVKYDDNDVPVAIDTIVVSTQHDEFDTEEKMQEKIKEDIKNILIPRVKKKSPKNAKMFEEDYTLHVNPTGKFVIGGPHGDTGLTGRKIIVDTYGGKGAHGGGAFSGKDPSKVDRSAAYATRHIAKNLVAAGVCDEALVQVAYAIGVAEPVGLYVNTYNSCKVKDGSGNVMSDGELAERISKIFDMRPNAIVKRLGLTKPIFTETAAYGHFGREPEEKEVEMKINGQSKKEKVVTFGWERLDYVDKLQEEFDIKKEAAV
jgi:S-adenosylmethionine synthetase